MTNWMTAAGLALIAGGLATLICFRSVLFGRGSRRAGPDIQPKPLGSKGSRRRSRPPEPLIPPAEKDPRGAPASVVDDLFPYEDEPRALEPARDHSFVDYEPEPVDYAPEPAELVGLELVPDLPPEPVPDFDDFDDFDDDEPDHPAERYGHRVHGWVRPEYQHVPEEPPAGEYWTPIPVDLDPDPEPSAKGYGWPAPVERLPSVPDYEPATGFDLAPVEHEPTEVVSARPDGRTPMPRSWAARNDKRESRSDRRERREWRTENEALPTTQLFAAASDDPAPARRRRPRPRPRPSVEPPERSTRMYVSRHAAEPPPR
ncbi:hypothetical protein M1L60_17535 [Actinoplanes sp. TRM 88003]|uniref:Uncharacterized protein n=1 Tax=Paractinoplanes aksuensis TaxID=2939490 RepID=A0ABT1DNM9_9ACTN|nr:hypothetical protein [Actinoplanes aksuensis]MCO8272400.1 hypothetical protein [Actinoplanes aksuensis]